MTHCCECPNEGTGLALSLGFYYEEAEMKAVGHPLGECPGDSGVRQYIRDGETLYLCSSCSLSGDIPAEAEG